ncbi:hypothetical protein [Motilibacter aurantiacus]|uniref:hypothetical protein n=1 Tax=Motilibacter aurantiacus TaxID=2714955 RepID=UPI001408FFEC|nr:hypothetical protein [Motilibacter aurantiacus]NHC44342.1 hypothetical protein [Motilibacter aurantiacus]
MIVIAVLLIALAVGVAVAVALQANEAVTVDMLGVSADTAAREVFFAGVLAAVVFGVGLWLLKASTARARRRRHEIKSLKRGRTQEVERLQAEKAELESALREQRSTPAPAATGSTDTTPAGGSSALPRDGRGQTAQSLDLTAAERRARAGSQKDQA